MVGSAVCILNLPETDKYFFLLQINFTEITQFIFFPPNLWR